MFQFEGYTLDTARNALRAADREIALRPKSFELLRYLLENADRLVTKEELLKAIWPNVATTDESLTHCVSEVRKAIGDGSQTIIKTVPRRGYRFAAPVLCVATGAAARAQPALPTAETPPAGTDSASLSQSFDRPSVAVLPFANLNGDPISATASPRTLQPSCRGSRSSWSSRAIQVSSIRTRRSMSGRSGGNWAPATCWKAASGAPAIVSASLRSSSMP
jgi:adenylate cyclase